MSALRKHAAYRALPPSIMVLIIAYPYQRNTLADWNESTEKIGTGRSQFYCATPQVNDGWGISYEEMQSCILFHSNAAKAIANSRVNIIVRFHEKSNKISWEV